MYVYRLTNRENDKVYIGQTVKSVAQRLCLHRWSVENHSTQAIHAAIRKYGWNVFAIDTLYTAKSIPELNAMETFFILLHQSQRPQNGYNRTLGGYKRKNVGQVPWNKGKRGSQVAWNKGLKMSEEYREKCRVRDNSVNLAKALATNVGRPKSAKWHAVMASRTGASNHFFGKKHSVETRSKMSVAKKRFFASDPSAKSRILSNLY